MSTTSIRIKPVNGAGAYVSGIDLNRLDKPTINLLITALGDNGVLFFREQSIKPEKHIELAECFGKININRFFSPVQEHPQIAQVLKEPSQEKNIGENWHTDHSYDQIPALGSILVARDLPSRGGDTLFAGMFAAYEGLSDDMKSKIAGLTATHSSRHVFGAAAFDDGDDRTGRLGNSEKATQDSVHPVVITHPVSGRKAIYVNPEFTVRINDMPEAKSDALLQLLYAHCQQKNYIHRFNWQPGSVAFWDNRATWHKALNDYPGQRRLMHRITVEGERLFA